MNAEPEEPVVERKKPVAKSWRTYAFEFSLLFTAVFLGFLADNLREVQAEKQQAEELAHSYYRELREDSVTLQTVLASRFRKDTALFRLKNYVLDSNLERVSREYIRNYIIGIHTASRFQPTDVILEQLKNSGSLRYFKSSELQQLTGNLSTSIALVRQRNDFELEFALNYLIPFVVEHNDQTFFGRVNPKEQIPFSEPDQGVLLKILEEDPESVTYRINNLSSFKRQDVYNMLWQYRNLLFTTTRIYSRHAALNAQLLAALRKEYGMNEE